MIAYVVAVGHHYTMADLDPARSRAQLRTALHHAVTDWLRGTARTPYPLAAKTADRVVATELADPDRTIVYLTAADLLLYREQTASAIRREYGMRQDPLTLNPV